jgi:hypothetical protein
MTVAASPAATAQTGMEVSPPNNRAQIDAAMTLFRAIHAKLVTKEQQRQQIRAGKSKRRARGDDGRHAERRADRREHGDQSRAEYGARHDDRNRGPCRDLSGQARAHLQRGGHDVGAGKDEEEIEGRLAAVSGGNRAQLNTLHAT